MVEVEVWSLSAHSYLWCPGEEASSRAVAEGSVGVRLVG